MSGLEREIEDFIKKAGLNIKDVQFVNEPITTVKQYHELYSFSHGSCSGDGYCIFFNTARCTTGYIYVFPKEIEDKALPNPSILTA